MYIIQLQPAEILRLIFIFYCYKNLTLAAPIQPWHILTKNSINVQSSISGMLLKRVFFFFFLERERERTTNDCKRTSKEKDGIPFQIIKRYELKTQVNQKFHKIKGKNIKETNWNKTTELVFKTIFSWLFSKLCNGQYLHSNSEI